MGASYPARIGINSEPRSLRLGRRARKVRQEKLLPQDNWPKYWSQTGGLVNTKRERKRKKVWQPVLRSSAPQTPKRLLDATTRVGARPYSHLRLSVREGHAY